MQTATLDTLVAEHTAFWSWDELKAQIDAGYVPTVRSDLFAAELEARGYRVFRVREAA